MSDLFEHFSINEEQKNSLLSQGIDNIVLVENMKLFDPYETNCELTKINIMYYMDERGNFLEDKITNPGMIANAMFESLDATDKIEIYEYVEFLDEEQDEYKKEKELQEYMKGE